MNKYFYLLLISSTVALYGQNPRDLAKHSLSKEKFDEQLRQANRDYERLNPAEKELSDLAGRNLAVMHARELMHGEGQSDLIPAEIDPKADVEQINKAFAKAQKNAKVSDDRLVVVCQIGYVRLSALWKQKADAVGKKCTWCLECDDVDEDISC